MVGAVCVKRIIYLIYYGLWSFDVLRRGDLMFFRMQRKRERRMHMGACMCAIVEVPALDLSNKILKESGSSVFWLIILLNFSEAHIF